MEYQKDFDLEVLSKFMQNLLSECGPVDYDRLLPICHVHQEDVLVTKDRKSDGMLRFNLYCNEGSSLPSRLKMKIMEGNDEAFSKDVFISPGYDKRFPDGSVFKTDICLPIDIVQRVVHNTNIEIIFSDGEKHRAFLLFLSWREINLEVAAEAKMAEAAFYFQKGQLTKPVRFEKLDSSLIH